MKVDLFKATKSNNLWHKGQKLWGVHGTGALAWVVLGRRRGVGIWKTGWIHLPDKDGRSFGGKPNAKFVSTVEVTQEFHDYLERLSGSSIRSYR